MKKKVIVVGLATLLFVPSTLFAIHINIKRIIPHPHITPAGIQRAIQDAKKGQEIGAAIGAVVGTVVPGAGTAAGAELGGNIGAGVGAATAVR